MAIKKYSIFLILLMAMLLSACHVVDQPEKTAKIPILGQVQLKLPRVPVKTLSPEEIQATTEAIIEKGIPAMKTSKGFMESSAANSYFIQAHTPANLQDFAHPELGCSWMGVAGQVFDKSGAPVGNMVVNLGGTISGVNVDEIGMTGTTQAYGPQSFEIKISDQVIAGKDLWIQLSDLAGNPVSPKFYFETFNDCQKNLVIVNFNQVDQITTLNFPIVSNQ